MKNREMKWPPEGSPRRRPGFLGNWGSLGLAGLLIAAPCWAQPLLASTELQADLRAEAGLQARIKGEIGDAHCSMDADCLTLAIGEKACGGPESWLAWSVTTGQGDLLKTWAIELARMQRRRNERHGMASNCQYIADPGAICQDRQCRLRSGGIEN